MVVVVVAANRWTQCTQQFDTGSGGSQLETGCNLCALSLVTLPGGLLMVDFAVSHQLGDGATYYRKCVGHCFCMQGAGFT